MILERKAEYNLLGTAAFGEEGCKKSKRTIVQPPVSVLGSDRGGAEAD